MAFPKVYCIVCSRIIKIFTANQNMQVCLRMLYFLGFRDAGQLWKDAYETPDFEEQLEKAHEEMKPFYLQLHAYIRRKLKAQYPQFVSKDGALPAHLLGNNF
jgi:hypothetical protein